MKRATDYTLKFFIILLTFFCFLQKSDLIAYTSKSKSKSSKIELAIVAIFRDEAPYLKEWIEYYRLQGVSKFYLYNNLSKDNYKKILAPYLKDKIVKLYQWNEESHDVSYWNYVQTTAYTHGMAKARVDKVHWLAVIDVDEFIVPIKHPTLLDLVKSYDNTRVGMLSASWIMFGTSGVHKIPKNKLMIETLLANGGSGFACEEKSILHTKRANTNGPHYGVCHPGYYAATLPLETVQINHYWSRDESFFYSNKIPKRIKWGWSQEVSEDFMNQFNSNEFSDGINAIQRFVPALRKAMNLTPDN